MNVTRLKSSLETNSFWRFAPQLGGGEVSGNYPRIMEEERGTSSYLANPIQAQLKFKIKTISVLIQIRKGRKGHRSSYPTEQTQFAHIFTAKLVFCTLTAVLEHYAGCLISLCVLKPLTPSGPIFWLEGLLVSPQYGPCDRWGIPLSHTHKRPDMQKV